MTAERPAVLAVLIVGGAYLASLLTLLRIDGGGLFEARFRRVLQEKLAGATGSQFATVLWASMIPRRWSAAMRMNPAAAASPARTRQRWLASLAPLLAVAMAMAGWPAAAAAPAAAVAGKAAETIVVVVRHAEKVLPTKLPGAVAPDEDPPLTPAGERRAAAIAVALADAGVTAIYSTPFRRTMQTAAPLAARTGIAVTSYDPHAEAVEFAQAVLAAYRGATVLVVGHSNTVPDIVAAFAGRPVEALEDTEYGRVYVIAVAADGSARLLRTGFPPFSAEALP